MWFISLALETVQFFAKSKIQDILVNIDFEFWSSAKTLHKIR